MFFFFWGGVKNVLVNQRGVKVWEPPNYLNEFETPFYLTVLHVFTSSLVGSSD